MPRWTHWPPSPHSSSIVAGLGATILLGVVAQAELPKLDLKTTRPAGSSQLDGAPRTPLRPPAQTSHIGSHGGVMIVDSHGLLVVERSAGKLVRADHDAKPVAELALTPGLGEIVHDGAGAVFVADRTAGRVLRIDPGDATGEGLGISATAELGEPHGLALTPDGATLLVTDVSEHALVALRTADLAPRWRVELGPEPRSVAVSRDGLTAAVGFLSSGSLAFVELDSAGERVHWRALDPRDHVEITERESDYEGLVILARRGEMRSKYQTPVETGRRYARNFFALAFVGHDLLVAPHELATPQLERIPSRDRADTYGGGAQSIPPLMHQLAVIERPGAIDSRANFMDLDVHQPRALAYDLPRDTLYVAGYGDDRVLAIADVTQQMPYVDWRTQVGDGRSCGIDGIALGPAGNVWIHCEFRRQALRLTVHDPATTKDDEWLRGAELTKRVRPEQIERGAELFRRGRDSKISADGMMACSNCHPEGRTDGLTWRLGDSILQTPILAGRVGDTAPYKWDGQDPSLSRSLRHTMERLGAGEFAGWGKTPRLLSDPEVDAMIAYVKSLEPPRPRKPKDPEAVARGRAVFEAEACNGCHAGAKLADGNQHALDTTLAQVDTPSLLGLSNSRPYYHDGSAKDLWTLLTDRGTIHEMADTSKLSDAQLQDLNAYLESL
ncbi:c-type cytochrome [Enhygromyxa salina]|uniref:Cytochrome c n=1 Tax=Enhygromyxa salina TaxID=215803 RepID=A0A2S9YMM5_9BACT|nr:c-type cytochrome [Enhygromyxa salina]PRQ06335.1 Cytochrome c [Enhygromyxa salina]